ncbi:MAG: hypothetical protein HY433_00630 [Candidatus Liptonbacteria bacterium]|nr:hypothetical protein [Candidatus Liptonbacteria bacterium]
MITEIELLRGIRLEDEDDKLDGAEDEEELDEDEDIEKLDDADDDKDME